MNKVGLRLRDPDPAYGQEKVIDLDGLLLAIRRQLKPVFFLASLGVMLGLAYLATTPKEYTAYATVLADDGANRIVAEISAFEESLQNEAVLLNQIEVIRSQKVALVVVDSLQLHQNETFLNPQVSLAARLVTGFKNTLKAVILPNPSDSAYEASEANLLSGAAGLLQKNVGVKRIGRSSAFLIYFTTQDPGLSAAIANAYAEAYMADQLNASFDATERTTIWLQTRLAELEANSRTAAEAVERFRSENGLSATDGRLVTEQQLAQLNAELSSAVADTARASALAAQYRAVLDAGLGDGLAARVLGLDAPPDSRLAGYQERIAALVSRLSQIEADRGAEHAETKRARDGLNNQVRAAFSEIARLAEQYSGEEAAARAREESLRVSVAEATSANNMASSSRVELRALEQRAQAVAALYQSFLTRFEEIEQHKSFPVSNIRLLSSAEPPRSASGPGTVKTILLGLILGVFAGACIGVLREFRDRSFRTSADITSETGLRFLGYLPYLKKMKAKKTASNARQHVSYLNSVHRHKALYSETLRAIGIALDSSVSQQDGPCLGVVSALPNEGKTTLGLSLAELCVAAGHKVLLVDADLRKPDLTDVTGVANKQGLIEVLVDKSQWRQLTCEVGPEGLHIMPSGESSSVVHTSEVLASPAMGHFLKEARQAYDYVIVDLPPLGPVVDTRAVLQHLDRLVLLAEWGKTPRGLMRQLLADDPELSDKTVGAVLNRVDISSLRLYGSAAGADRFRGAYQGYQSKIA